MFRPRGQARASPTFAGNITALRRSYNLLPFRAVEWNRSGVYNAHPCSQSHCVASHSAGGRSEQTTAILVKLYPEPDPPSTLGVALSLAGIRQRPGHGTSQSIARCIEWGPIGGPMISGRWRSPTCSPPFFVPSIHGTELFAVGSGRRIRQRPLERDSPGIRV